MSTDPKQNLCSLKLHPFLENLIIFFASDDSIRSACAYAIHSIGIHNQDILKTYSETVLPLVFFAMHAEKTPETEKTLEVWNEIWSEQSPGTETGIRQNLRNISDMLKTALESPSWTMKAQVSSVKNDRLLNKWCIIICFSCLSTVQCSLRKVFIAYPPFNLE